jgi:hypothetical protein
MVVRRNLLFAAAFGVIVQSYAIDPSVPWLDLKTDGLGGEVLRGALAIANIYLLFMFCTYVWDDYRRWRLVSPFIEIGSLAVALEELHQAMAALESAIHTVLPDSADKRRLFEFEQFTRLERAYGHVRGVSDIHWADRVSTQRHKVILVQRLRLLLLDVGIPIALGIFAVWRLTPSLWPFVSRVVSPGSSA